MNQRGASRAGIVAGLLFVAIALFIAFQTMSLEAATCEVCIEYRGRSMCRTVGGATEQEARQAAITNACAFLSGGVTDSMACGRQPPTSERCW
jgi:hypothetical protein